MILFGMGQEGLREWRKVVLCFFFLRVEFGFGFEPGFVDGSGKRMGEVWRLGFVHRGRGYRRRIHIWILQLSILKMAQMI